MKIKSFLLRCIAVFSIAVSVQGCSYDYGDDAQIQAVYQIDPHNYYVRYEASDIDEPNSHMTIDTSEGNQARLVYQADAGGAGLVVRGDFIYTLNIFNSLIYQGKEIWSDRNNEMIPEYLKTANRSSAVIMNYDYKNDIIQYIYSDGRQTAWNTDGEVLGEIKMGVEIQIDSGCGSFCWTGEGIDADKIEAVVLYEWGGNGSEIVNKEEFIRGANIKIPDSKKYLLYVLLTEWVDVSLEDYICIDSQ